MISSPDALSVLPPLVAIAVALMTRRVMISLLTGIVAGLAVISNFEPLHTAEALVALFIQLLGTAWILKTLAFAVLVGAVMELVRRSGGIDGFVHLLQTRFRLLGTQRSALLLVYGTGLFIFIESSITSLVAGAVGRPLASRFGFSREKLAYVCDSTAAPVCSLLLFNGWGALLLGLIVTQLQAGYLQGEAVAILVASVVFNFYAMTALLLTFVVIWFGWNVGQTDHVGLHETVRVTAAKTADASLMLIPIGVMILGVFAFMFVTGNGRLLQGSGSSSVFYTMLVTLAVIAVQYRVKKVMSWKAYVKAALHGMIGLMPIAMVLLLAFAIGKVIDMAGTGAYLASFLGKDAGPWLPAAVFLLGALMAFATGTSWGTFSVMLPIAVVMGSTTDAYIPLLIGAVISGGVFGDHCSPISDTTIIASLAAGCDHIDHVRTQLPYALIAGGVSLGMFMVAGIVLSR